jgi:hypothetical protein
MYVSLLGPEREVPSECIWLGLGRMG